MSKKENTWSWWAILLSSIVPIFFLTGFFFGSRGIMDLGGFVASGGPYAIEHPAPNWICIWSVSFTIVVLTFFFFLFISDRLGGANLLTPSWWSLIFLSQGWNFLEYALIRYDGVVWGWLVCGVLFIAMGVVPLWFIFDAYGYEGILASLMSNRRTVILQLIGSAIGISLGVLVFHRIMR